MSDMHRDSATQRFQGLYSQGPGKDSVFTVGLATIPD
jgi:hypothetical protein